MVNLDWKVFGQIMGVIRVSAGCASNNEHAAAGALSRHVAGKVEVEELVVKWTAIGHRGCRRPAPGTRREIRKGLSSLEGVWALSTATRDVVAFIDALANSRGGGAQPPTVEGGVWRSALMMGVLRRSERETVIT